MKIVARLRSSYDQKVLFASLFIFIVGMIFWYPTRDFGFVWDDQYFIIENSAIRDWSQVPQYFTELETMSSPKYSKEFILFRPLRNISYLLDFSLFAYSPAGWHLHNVLLHSINGVLLFLLLMKLKIPLPGALFSSIIFLVHPLQTEVVCWVKSRDDLLAAGFTLLALLLWTGIYHRAVYKKMVPVLCLLYFLGMLSKVQVIVLPGLFFLLAIFFENRFTFKTIITILRKHSTLWVGSTLCAVCYLIWRHLFIGQSHQTGYLAGDFFKTQMSMTEAWRIYANLILFPLNQSADYIGLTEITVLSNSRLWVNLAILGVLGGMGYFLSRKNILIGVACGCILLSFLPMANILPMMQLLAERFAYMPMIGVCILWGAAFKSFQKYFPSMALGAMALLICVFYATLAYKRMPIWENELTLFGQTTMDAPENNWRSWENYLSALHNQQKSAQIVSISHGILENVQNNGGISSARYQKFYWILGNAYFELGEKDKGLEILIDLQQKHPDYYEIYDGLGTLYAFHENYQEAEKWFREGLKIKPHDPYNRFQLALSLENQNRFSEAFDHYHQALKSSEATDKIYLSCAALYWKTGDFKEANRIYAEGLKKWPHHQEMLHWFNQSELHMQNKAQ